jgi:hypothetical protein
MFAYIFNLASSKLEDICFMCLHRQDKAIIRLQGVVLCNSFKVISYRIKKIVTANHQTT